jgi:YidC/Oxa1 family membrane protein insertase
VSELWNGLLSFLGGILQTFHDAVAPLFGTDPAWGWAIIMLTLAVRIVLIPLAIKQTSSMRQMQQLSPQIKKIQARYKTDRSMMRSDPQKYKELKAKQQEETMALYKERGVNPAGSCLPLVLQMPIFLALFNVIRDSDIIPTDASFYFGAPLSATATDFNPLAIALIVLMGITTFISQRQTMAANPAMADNPQQRQIMTVMPIMLTVFGVGFPIGVLLYWVTTNLWTMAQQYVLLRNVGVAPAAAGGAAPAAALAGPAPAVAGDDASAQSPKKASAPKGTPTPKRRDARDRSSGATKAPQDGRNPRGTTSRSAKQQRS